MKELEMHNEMNNRAWLKKLTLYEKPELRHSILQIINSIIPFLVIVAAMFYLEFNGYPYWMTLLLAIPASLFFVRIFIIQHDCGHNSFFESIKANDMLGNFCSLLTLIPYREFQHSHNIHHANSGKLEKRGVGDIWTMTVDEYKSAGKWTKFMYRTYRNPIAFLTLGPIVLILKHRLPSPSSRPSEVKAIMALNAFIIACLAAAYFTIGISSYLKVLAPILFIAEAIGMWLFFVQHCFEEAYWEKSENWNLMDSALKGSSYYKLPRVLQWFTGNIGFHHIHHLRSRIPNYKLEECHKKVEELQNVNSITIAESIRMTKLKLYDTNKRKLVTYKEVN